MKTKQPKKFITAPAALTVIVTTGTARAGTMRFYSYRAGLFDGTWDLPDVEFVK